MANVIQFVKNPYTIDWLREFTSLMVDNRRLQRGITLYRSGAVVLFRETDQGFYAQVTGSRHTPYEVMAHIHHIDANGYVDINGLHLSCSCPDVVDVCKHAVCAVIRFAVLMDERLTNGSLMEQAKLPRKSTSDLQFAWKMPADDTAPEAEQPFVQLEQLLHPLLRHAQSSDHTLPNLPQASFWPFKERLPRVMADLHHIVERGVREVPPRTNSSPE